MRVKKYTYCHIINSKATIFRRFDGIITLYVTIRIYIIEALHGTPKDLTLPHTLLRKPLYNKVSLRGNACVNSVFRSCLQGRGKPKCSKTTTTGPPRPDRAPRRVRAPRRGRTPRRGRPPRSAGRRFRINGSAPRRQACLSEKPRPRRSP